MKRAFTLIELLMVLANHLLSFRLRHLGLSIEKPVELVFGWLNVPLAWLMGCRHRNA